MRAITYAVATLSSMGLLAGCEDLPARDDPREPECAAGAAETRVRYQEPSVAFGEACAMEEQTRSCAGGRWTAWEGSFEYYGCEVSEPRDCQNPAAAHATTESRFRFEAFEVPFGGECTSEEQSRTCYDGAWSGWSGNFAAATCRVGDPAACTAPDAGHGTGDVRVRYATATVPFGETCQSEQQTRTCFNGEWSQWTGSHSFESCMVDPPAACTDPEMPHGATDQRIRFLEPEAPVVSCESEQQSRTCFDGTWSEWSGTYEFETCDSPELAAIRILPSKPILDVQESYPFRAIGTLEDGSEEDISDRVAWSSDAPAIVTVSDAGLATGKSIGSATVRAAVENLEAEVAAEVYRWRYATLDYYLGLALDFGGDRTDRVTLGWVVDDAVPGTLYERTWEQGVWSSITEVATEDDGVSGLRVATNSRGDKHVLWTKPTGATPGTFEVRARDLHFQSNTWSDISTLTSTGDDPRAPSLSVSHLGHSLATWFEAGAQAYAAFSASGGWPSSGTPLAGRHSHAAAVDLFGDGIILAAETQSSPTVGGAVHAYHYVRDDDSVGPPIIVWETSTEGGVPEELASDVRLGMDGTGNAIVAWVRKHGDQSAVMTARYDADTGWEPASVLFDAGESPIVLGNLSVHVSGTAALAFASSSGGQGLRLFVATFAPASDWSAPTPLSSAGREVLWTELVERETVATNHDGRALAVWSEPNDTGTSWLVARRYDPDIGWGAPRFVALGGFFTHESAFGVRDGWFVGYVQELTNQTLIKSATFREF
jgi:hypothetical protein